MDAAKRQNDSITVLPHTIVKLKTSDGLQLEGWHIPCKTVWYDSLAPLRSTVNYDHKGTIIMFHGHGACRAALLNEANAFLRRGFNVFMIDFRAHGNSDGEQCLVGMKETADVKVAYDYVVGTGEKNIILYGMSMGASTVLKTIKENGLKPAKLILEMPFASLLDATVGKLKLMHLPEVLARPVVFWGGTLNGKWAFNYKPYLDANAVSCPVLLQWGRHDPRVARYETEEIFKHLKGEKKLVIYENAAHESLYKAEPEKWLSETQAFLNN